MYDDILLPVDGSESATAIVEHAAAIADATDATVRVLHVADTTHDSVTVVSGEVVDALEDEGAEIVEDVAATLADLDVDHVTDVVQGGPAETIVDYAERYGYDLIVLPTRGRTGLERTLLGSVTERVVRLSAVPVLTARMRPDEQLTFPYERVLIATDGSADSTAAIRHGLALATALDASVHALSVVDDSGLGASVRSALSGTETEAAADEAVAEVAALAADVALERSAVETHVVHGSPAEAIEDAIAEHAAHVVVMGTSGRRGTDRILLGSVAERTVRSAPVPVITVGARE